MSTPRSTPLPRSLAVLLLLLGAACARLGAQGGPPMMTDDPGTAPYQKLETIVLLTDQRTPGVSAFEIPQLQLNYGLGQREEINFQTGWLEVRDRTGSHAAWEQSQLGFKWRPWGEADKGPAFSFAPQVTFQSPGSEAARRGLVEDGTQFFLPVEGRLGFGEWQLGMDFGRTFSSGPFPYRWSGGVVAGRDVREGLNLAAEVRACTDARFGRPEWIVNLGTRIDMPGDWVLISSVGRDLSAGSGDRTSLYFSIGVDFIR